MSEQLYQERIVALAKAKTGAGKLASPTKSARRDNPLCGDRVTIDVKLDGQGRIAEIAQQVRGCLLCQASASRWRGSRSAAMRPASPRSVTTPSAPLDARPASRRGRSPPSPRCAITSPARSACLLPFEALKDALS